MNGSAADAMIRKAGEMLERGEIPDDVALPMLWAGMAYRSRQDEARDRRVGKLETRFGIVAGTLAVEGSMLLLLGAALLRHLGG